MFDSLAEKLQGTLADVRNHGTLTEGDIDGAMREIRLALLEADVNFKVVRQFTAQVKERCLGAEVIGKLNPGQQVVKIVAEELTRLMGGPPTRGAGIEAPPSLSFSARPPTVILMGCRARARRPRRRSSRGTYVRSTPRRSRSRHATFTVRPRLSSW